ncbi:MAG: pentapeptide repeat-containing protein [Nostoc sp.]
MIKNYHNANLQGRSFKDCDLTNQDFSGANIRGAKFDNAILKNANFSRVRAGLQTYWILIWFLVTLLLAALAGILSTSVGIFATQLLTSNNRKEFGELSYVPGLLVLFILLYISIITIQKGIIAGIKSLSVLIILAIPITITLDYFIKNKFAFTPVVIFLLLSVSLLFISALVEILAVNLVNSINIAVAIVIIISIFSAGIIPFLIPGLFAAKKEIKVLSVLVSIAISFFNNYLAWKATGTNKELVWIRRIAIDFAAISGTSFRGADLTDADFTGATLKNTDFRKANLIRTCWLHTQKLNLACVEETYLEEQDIRQLVLTKDGRGKNFDYRNLAGLNLQNANLKDASFIGANLSEANLQQATLSMAKLVQTQLYRTDLTKACLTGAYIQNWGISIETKLLQVECEHVYMRLPTKLDPDPYRKPDNNEESFQEGDFSDFIAPMIKTLDLYRSQNVDMRKVATTFKSIDIFHRNGIDPRAAAVALQELADKYPQAGIEVVALEGRGNEKIRLQVKVKGTADRSELSAEYFEKYDNIKTLSSSKMQGIFAGITEKNQQIQMLEKLLVSAIQQPKFYVETYQHQGEFIMSQSKGNISIDNVEGSVSGIAAAGENQKMTGVIIGEIRGSVTNTISNLPDSSEPDKPSLKELLVQLQAAIEAEPNLPEEDKAEALEQIKTLAEAAQKPEDNILQKAAKTAIKILKGTVSSLPEAAKLVEASTKLLPIISKLLLLV